MFTFPYESPLKFIIKDEFSEINLIDIAQEKVLWGVRRLRIIGP